MKIEYTKVGDYYLPNLYYPEETRPIGFWGILRKKYLKEHKSGTYTYLLPVSYTHLDCNSLYHFSRYRGNRIFFTTGEKTV